MPMSGTNNDNPSNFDIGGRSSAEDLSSKTGTSFSTMYDKDIDSEDGKGGTKIIYYGRGVFHQGEKGQGEAVKLPGLPAKHHDTPFFIKYITAFSAAAVAETVTYPLDLTKTRMQIFGEMDGTQGKGKRAGMLRTALGIVKDEGPLHLWKGILPALYRHVIYSGIRMALYEKLRDDVFGKSENGTFPVWKAACAGFIVGGFAQFTASPMDLVKVQLQMEGRRKLEGKPPRVRNASQAVMLIYRQGGLRGLWKGWVPNVQRGALVNLGDLTTYDTGKRFLITNFGFEDTILVHVLSSLLAGFTAALMGTPADVIKTHVMNQPTNELGQGLYYKNSIDCLRKTVSNEGFGALYKGLLPIWMRLGPWSLTFWVTFEKIRGLIGIGGF